MSRTFFVQQIAKVQVQITAYEDVLTFFAVNNTVQSYTLNTEQSVQTVTRAQLSSIRVLLDNLYNRLATLEARVYGSAITARPGW